MSHQDRVKKNNLGICSFCLDNLVDEQATFRRPYVDANGIIKTLKCCKKCFYNKSTD